MKKNKTKKKMTVEEANARLAESGILETRKDYGIEKVFGVNPTMISIALVQDLARTMQKKSK